MKKLIITVTVGVIFLWVAGYHLTFYLMPNITVNNQSQLTIESAHVTLPSSHLDFGLVHANAENTLYYDLDQADGVYRYLFKLSDGRIIEGNCGYVTQSEINKRVSIILTAEYQVNCQQD